MNPVCRFRPVKNNKGFTIIEIMIALGILSIGILAVATMQLHAAKGNRTAGLRTMAVSLAAEKMEELSAKGYSHADLDIGTHTESAGQFDIAWTVSGSTPIAGTKSITLTVDWNNGDDTVEFSHIIAKLD